MDVYLQYDLTVLWEHLTKKRLSKPRKSRQSAWKRSSASHDRCEPTIGGEKKL